MGNKENKEYIHEFLDYNGFSKGNLCGELKSKIIYYFGVAQEYLKNKRISRENLVKTIKKHSGPSEFEKDLKEEINLSLELRTDPFAL